MLVGRVTCRGVGEKEDATVLGVQDVALGRKEKPWFDLDLLFYFPIWYLLVV